MNRGDRCEPILLDHADRQRCIETLAEVCAAGLRYPEFDVTNQATWQLSEFFSDGHRVLFLSMEPRRDGPGRPFEEYYRQTPTQL